MKWILPLVLFSLSAIAKPGAPEKKRDWEIKLAQMLALTSEQQEQVTSIRKKHRDEIKKLKESVRASKKELMTAMQTAEKGESYQKSLSEKFAKVQEAKSQLANARFKVALEVREVLKPEQLAKFRGLRVHHERDEKDGK